MWSGRCLVCVKVRSSVHDCLVCLCWCVEWYCDQLCDVWFAMNCCADV